MTHKMTNEEIKAQYEAQGGPPIVHKYNEDGRPATGWELLRDALIILAVAAVIWLVF